MYTYLVESNDYIVITKKINDILMKNNLSSDVVIKYDMLETSISKVIEELDTYNFLSDRKVVVCENCFFLSTTKVKISVDWDISLLKKYIVNSNPINILILICDKLSSKLEIKELMASNVDIINTAISLEDIIKEELKGYKITGSTIKYLMDYCLNDNERILNEVEKLKLYKLEEKEINNVDINEIVVRSYDDDIFDLVNAVVKRDKYLAFDIYKRLIVNERDVTGIIGSISNNIRNMYISKILTKVGLSNNEISERLGVKPGAIYIALENGRSFSEVKLLSLLNELADLDLALKSTMSNSGTLFELFLLKL